MRCAHFYALTVVILSAPFAKGEVNLLDNGSFEEGNTGFTSGYRYSPGNLQPEGSYDVVTNPHNSHPLAPSYGDHTTGTGKMLAFNGATTPGVVAWTETVVVQRSTTYSFAGWISSWSAGGPSASLNIYVNSVLLKQVDVSQTSGVWESFGGAWTSGTDPTATLAVVDTRVDATGNDFALDDLSFIAIPEPASLALLPVGALALLRRHRVARPENPTEK
jgi:hypothetical protein